MPFAAPVMRHVARIELPSTKHETMRMRVAASSEFIRPICLTTKVSQACEQFEMKRGAQAPYTDAWAVLLGEAARRQRKCRVSGQTMIVCKCSVSMAIQPFSQRVEKGLAPGVNAWIIADTSQASAPVQAGV